MTKDIPITQVRSVLTSLPARFSEGLTAITVTRRGKPVLAILPWEFYDALVETLEILGDKQMMALLRQGIEEAKQEKGIPWEDAKRKLGL